MKKLNLDKNQVVKVVQSLLDYNVQILRDNGIEEPVDDYLYLNIKLNQPIDFKNEIPVQIKLPHPMFNSEDAQHSETLLIVKEKPENYQQIVADLGLKAITEIKTPNELKVEANGGKGNLVKKMLAKFDLILIDDRLSLKTVSKDLGGQLLRKRFVPIPVNLSTPTLLSKHLHESFLGCHLLLHPGQDFIVRCAKTASLSKKQIVKNVMNAAVRACCLVFYAQAAGKHNGVKEIQVQTTKSLALTVYEQKSEE